MNPNPEQQRLTANQQAAWRRWGVYLGERAWGTIRESPPTSPDPWLSFPWEQAHRRTYRWMEDGIAGWCDDQQQICYAVAFWNEADDRLKERFFGLSNQEGNHGEDVKEYYWYSDGLPSGAYMCMRYLYPQVAYPYERLRQENRLRTQAQPAFNLIDALPQTFREQRYFDITIEYAKRTPDAMLCRITAINRGPEPAALHIVPKLWFPDNPDLAAASAEIRQQPSDGEASQSPIVVQHAVLGNYHWWVDSQTVVFSDYLSNTHALYDQAKPASAKDAIDRFVVHGDSSLLNEQRRGTQAAAHYQQMLEPGATWSVVIGFAPASESQNPLDTADTWFTQRRAEADTFYQAIADQQQLELQQLQRAAFAGLNWNKLVYRFNQEEWLATGKGDHTSNPEHPDHDWLHLRANDVLVVPDRWEFPILAMWDLDVQIVTLSLIDPEFAKAQALLLLSERYQHPNGAIPTTEGALEVPHPPIHAWAVWQIYQHCGQDQAFLQAAYPNLKRHFEWWLRNHRQPDGLFKGCFLGLDNISVIDRHQAPEGYRLVQADATGWMAHFALILLQAAIELGNDADACRFLDEFLTVRQALTQLWDAQDRFFYDALVDEDDNYIPLKVRSLVGLIPLIATSVIDLTSVEKLPQVAAQLKKLDQQTEETPQRLLLTAVGQHWKPLLDAVFDEAEFLSPYGIRSMSLRHAEQPVELTLDGESYQVAYEPGEAQDRMFGGNSNWRGPIWLPLNQLLLEAVDMFQTGLVAQAWQNAEFSQLTAARDSLTQRLIHLFLANDQAHRPYLAQQALPQHDPLWQEQHWFYEYFHAETGEGLGASHQHGWTAAIAGILHHAQQWNVSLKSPITA